MSLLNQLLDATVQPALGSAVCCRYRPATRTLSWAQAGHPAPLLFRNGTGRPLDAPDGVLLGATSGAAYEQAEVTLDAGDLLMLYTDGLVPRRSRDEAVHRLLDLAPASARRAPHRTAYGRSWRNWASSSARTTPACSSPGWPTDTYARALLPLFGFGSASLISSRSSLILG